MAALTAVSLFAGFIDAIAGGSGLITLPALLIAGIDPMAALATNKLQSASGTISATIVFARKGILQWRAGLPMALMALLGGNAGALCASLAPKSVLESIVPILLILVALYFALSPKLNDETRHAKLSVFIFSMCVAPLIGFYDGIFGPGAGSFFMVSCTLLLGQNILQAVSNAKLANAASNIGALIVFLAKGAIIIPLAIAMACGALIGAQIGARCAMRFGPRLIKPLLIITCCIMATKLMLTPSNALRQYLIHYLG
ncbi:MAG: TSUP family transporter [Ottowia sp.]|nr:TSUP family transporter [Ottowia sp.]